jgi:hypothetical protein
MSCPTLYVIGTDPDGRVVDSVPCPRGIDEALSYIADRLTEPEGDSRASLDVVAGRWNDICEQQPYWEDGDPTPYEQAVFSRRGFSTRYGLAMPTCEDASADETTRSAPRPTAIATKELSVTETGPTTASTEEGDLSWQLFHQSYGHWLDMYRNARAMGGMADTERRLREAAGLAGVSAAQLRADKARAHRGETSQQILEGR